MYKTRSQWGETNYDGESYFCKPEFSRSIKKNCTKVSYLNHSILVQKTQNLLQSSLLIFSKKNLKKLLGNVCFKKTWTNYSSDTVLWFVQIFLKQTLCRDLDSYHIISSEKWGWISKILGKFQFHSLLRSALIFQNYWETKPIRSFFEVIIVFEKPSVGKKNLKFEVSSNSGYILGFHPQKRLFDTCPEFKWICKLWMNFNPL